MNVLQMHAQRVALWCAPLLLVAYILIRPFWITQSENLAGDMLSATFSWLCILLFTASVLVMRTPTLDTGWLKFVAGVTTVLSVCIGAAWLSGELRFFSFFGHYLNASALVSILSFGTLAVLGYVYARLGGELKMLAHTVVYSTLFIIFALSFGEALGFIHVWHLFGAGFSTYLFAGLAFILSGALSISTQGTQSFLYVLWMLVCGTFLLTSDSLLLVAVTALVTALVVGSSLRERRRNRGYVSVFVISIMLLGGAFAISSSAPSLNSPVDITPAFPATLHVTLLSLAENNRALLHGMGPQIFERQWNLHLPLPVNTSAFWDVDFATGSSLLLVLVIVFGIPITATLFLLGIRGAIVFMTTNSHVLLHTIGAGTLLFVSMVVWFAFPSVAFLGVVSVLVGASIGARHSHESLQGSEYPILFRLVLVVMLLVSGATLYASVQHARGVHTFVGATQEKNTPELISALEDGYALFPSPAASRYLANAHVTAVIDSFDGNIYAITTDTTSHEVLERFIVAEQHATAATLLNPNNYRNWLTLGRTQMIEAFATGNIAALQDAQGSFENAYNMSSARPHALFAQAELALLIQEFGRANTYLTEALQLKPDYTAGLQLREQLQGHAL